MVVLCRQPLAQERWGREGLGGGVRTRGLMGVERRERGEGRGDKGKGRKGKEREGKGRKVK